MMEAPRIGLVITTVNTRRRPMNSDTWEGGGAMGQQPRSFDRYCSCLPMSPVDSEDILS